jgi:hypothetical protein
MGLEGYLHRFEGCRSKIINKITGKSVTTIIYAIIHPLPFAHSNQRMGDHLGY